jgi:hypothetical protein
MTAGAIDSKHSIRRKVKARKRFIAQGYPSMLKMLSKKKKNWKEV